MKAVDRASWRNRGLAAVVLVCITGVTAACGGGTTNNTGNCNAQGGNNGVTCIGQTGSPGMTVAASPGMTQPTTSAAEQSSAPISQYLGNLDPISDDGMIGTGVEQVNGAAYPNSLVFYLNPGSPSVSYNLGRQWRKLDMTLGLRDDSAENQDVQFQFVADQRAIYARTFTVGQAQHIVLNVTGVLRLQIICVEVSTNYVGPVYAIVGNATLLS
jgi:hypothetical protein